jgi:hypothetical protein
MLYEKLDHWVDEVRLDLVRKTTIVLKKNEKLEQLLLPSTFG